MYKLQRLPAPSPLIPPLSDRPCHPPDDDDALPQPLPWTRPSRRGLAAAPTAYGLAAANTQSPRSHDGRRSPRTLETRLPRVPTIPGSRWEISSLLPPPPPPPPRPSPPSSPPSSLTTPTPRRPRRPMQNALPERHRHQWQVVHPLASVPCAVASGTTIALDVGRQTASATGHRQWRASPWACRWGGE